MNATADEMILEITAKHGGQFGAVADSQSLLDALIFNAGGPNEKVPADH